MKTYKIEIKETLSRIIEIDANSLGSAISIVHEQYKNEEIILDSTYFLDVEFSDKSNISNL